MQPFATNLDIMVHHHEPECHAKKGEGKKKRGVCLQGEGHSVGLYNQNMTVSAISFISSKTMCFLQPNSI